MRIFTLSMLFVLVSTGCTRNPNASAISQPDAITPLENQQPESSENDPPNYVEFGKAIADMNGEEFDEDKWIAERNKGLAPEEREQMAIDLRHKPHPDQTKEFTTDQLKQLFSTEQNLEIVRNTDDAEFYFVMTNKKEGFLDSLSNYERVTEPKNVSAKQCRKIMDQLADARNYGWVAARKGCLPSPGIALKLISNDDEMTVVFCFACNILVFYESDAKIGGGDFDMMRPQIVEILKSLYPKNKLIQGLPLSGCGLTESK